MTEAQWLSFGNSNPSYALGGFHHLGVLSERKLRLFFCGCSRLLCPEPPDEPTRRALEVAERFVDGLASPDDVAAARRDVSDCHRKLRPREGAQGDPVRFWGSVPRLGAAGVAECALREPGTYLRELDRYYRGDLCGMFEGHVLYDTVTTAFMAFSHDEDGEAPEPRQVLGEILGDPFHPVTLNPEWLTSTVVALARQMYDSGDFGAMPILADALQDAGCDNAAILDHCRGPGPHVRGCWVVDLVLGRE